ncbi:MAG TPA: hypothetical protein VLL97_14480 [Acidobacteriota bacterium]|nr:hypothetical protein [Acidobacteriota bacterium]
MKKIGWTLALMMTVAAHAQECDYKNQLIAQFPFYTQARGIFAPVYPALATQLVQDYGFTEGIAVDLGGGEGSLARELARITGLTVYNVDFNPAASRIWEADFPGCLTMKPCSAGSPGAKIKTACGRAARGLCLPICRPCLMLSA